MLDKIKNKNIQEFPQKPSVSPKVAEQIKTIPNRFVSTPDKKSIPGALPGGTAFQGEVW